MYLCNIPNHFYTKQITYPSDTLMYKYHEKFTLDTNDPDRLNGIFYFKKMYFGHSTDINVWSIYSDIIILDNKNKNKYIEKYIFKQIYDKSSEEYEFGKMFYNNSFMSYSPINFNDLSDNIKNLIYLKNDKNIIECSCCIKNKE
jgi:hypothetical protein